MGGCCGKEDNSAQDHDTERSRLVNNRSRQTQRRYSEGSDGVAESLDDADGTLKAILRRTVRTIIDVRDGAEIDHQERIRRYHDHVTAKDGPRTAPTPHPAMTDVANLERCLAGSAVHPQEFVQIIEAGQAAHESLHNMAPPVQDDLLVPFDG